MFRFCHRLWGLVAVFLTLGAGTALAQEAPSQVVPEPRSEAMPSLSVEEIGTPTNALEIMLVPLTAADLAELAEIWQLHLRSALEDATAIYLDLLEADDATAEILRQQIADLREEESVIKANYQSVLEAWRAKGAVAEEIAPHDAYLDALTVAALQTTDLRTLFVFAVDWATSWDGGLGVILQIVGFVLGLWVLMFFARLLQKATKRALDRIPNMSRLLRNFIGTAIYWAFVVLGALVVLGVFGVNVTPLFAIFGGLSFILGFALQETLGNLASGLMIMVLKPFDTGDYIQIGTSAGFVDEMSVVSTKIRTFDNQIIVVPNAKIWGDVITNVSASAERRVDLVFGIGYSDSANQAIMVLKELVAAHPMCIDTPEPEIFVGELGDSSVNIFCRPWCKSDDYWTVYWDLTGQAKERFDAEGISIPFPQRDVHLFQVTDAVAKT